MSRFLTLGLVTFMVLVLELALIRWLAAQVRVVAYFPNLVLIAAFFGMGLGCMRQGKRSTFWLLPSGMLALVCLAWWGSGIAFSAKEGSEYFWLLYYNLPDDAPVVHTLLLPLWLLFVGTTLVFVPLGQKVANILKECQDADHTLLGYAFDLGGSLLGVIAFTLLSLLETFPIVWFAVALVPGLALLMGELRRQLVYVVFLAAILLVVSRAEYAQRYSPYYALNAVAQTRSDSPKTSHIKVSTNGSLHQVMVPIDSDVPPPSKELSAVRKGFNRPFEYLKTAPRNALVLGAGTGNDVAVLLENDVTQIDAVEIDPVILQLGQRMHPDDPYSAEGVTPHVGDARSYLNNCKKTYDLIIFGTLDSMTRLSALSNVRLDNFVYTRESLEAAKRLLNEGGGVILHFSVGEDHIHMKIIAMIAEVFGEYPVIHDDYCYLFNQSYMAGPAFSHVQRMEREKKYAVYQDLAMRQRLELPTDDWPYLYLEGRQVGLFYQKMILLLLLTAIGMMSLITVDSPGNRTPWGKMDLPMFMFGAAFLILNTKSVTEIGLIWGNTWMTNSLTFASILFVLLLSTLLFAYRPLPMNWCFAALFISLLCLYVFPLSALMYLPVLPKLLGTIVYVGLPFFFAGACFAGVFKTSRDVPIALGWNVFGALCGGLLEYTNMLLGFRALYLLALVFYLIAYLFYKRRAAEAV